MRNKKDLEVVLPVAVVIIFILYMLLYAETTSQEEENNIETTSKMSITKHDKADVKELTVPNVQATEPIKNNKLWDVPLEEELQIYINVICRNSPIAPETIVAMCEKESQYNTAAVGDNGNSIGLLQIQPRYHQERMERLNCPDLCNPYDNVTVALDILEELWFKYGKIEMVLMAYNGGCAYAEEQQWVSQYALDVMNRTRELKKSKNE